MKTLGFIFTVIFCYSTNAYGLCLPDLFDYSLEAELKRSTSVVIATPIKATHVMDTKDPESYTGTFYELDTHRRLYGHAITQVWDANDSGRYSPELNQPYLLFITMAPDGGFKVDACGNSGLVSEKTESIALLDKMAQKDD